MMCFKKLVKNGIFIVPFMFLLFVPRSDATIWHVDKRNQNAIKNGSSLYPFATITEAISSAASGDEIRVATSVYYENLLIDGKSVSLKAGYEGGTTLQYDQGEGGDFEFRNINLHNTIIEGQSHMAVIELRNNTSGSLIDGFTISGGQRGVLFDTQFTWPHNENITISNNIIVFNGSQIFSEQQGGGISIAGNNHIIEYNIISSNYAGRGGGISANGLNTIIRKNQIIKNNALSDHGGGCYLFGNVTFSNNVVAENRVGVSVGYGWGGGAIFLETGGATAISENNIYYNNHAPTYGGGVFADEAARLQMKNDLIYSNTTSSASHGGAGIAVDRKWDMTPSEVWIENCTIADNINTAQAGGNAIYVDQHSAAYIKNSILWNNGGDFYVDPSSVLELSYSISEDSYSGLGVFHQDPLFAEPTLGVYQLKSKAGRYNDGNFIIDSDHSPAIDAGDPASEYNMEPYPHGDRINMGSDGNTSRASLSLATSYSESIIIQKSIIVWPSVTSHQLNIKSEMTGANKIFIYSSEGIVLGSGIIEQGTTVLDVSFLAAGIYTLVYLDNGLRYAIRFVKV